MDNFDLSSAGGSGKISVLEYQGKKNLTTKKVYNNIYVKGFPQSSDFTEDDLAELFKEFGQIVNVAIMKDGEGNSKGFGFVCFDDPSSAEKASLFVSSRSDNREGEDAPPVKEVKGVKLTDLYVSEAKKKKDRQKEIQQNLFRFKKSIMMFTLFVKNFPVGISEDDLKNYFAASSNGNDVVTKVKIVG